MALYRFKCPTCGLEKDVIQKFNELPPFCPICCCNPDCQGDDEVMVKLLSKPAGFRLKDDGWYADGYQKKKKPVVESEPPCEGGT